MTTIDTRVLVALLGDAGEEIGVISHFLRDKKLSQIKKNKKIAQKLHALDGF